MPARKISKRRYAKAMALFYLAERLDLAFLWRRLFKVVHEHADKPVSSEDAYFVCKFRVIEGCCCLQFGNSTGAVGKFGKAWIVAAKIEDPDRRADIYGGLAICHANIKLYGISLDCLKKMDEAGRNGFRLKRTAVKNERVRQRLRSFGVQEFVQGRSV